MLLKKNARLYLLMLTLPLLFMGILSGLSYLYLWKSDEFRSITYIVEKQLRTNGLYGSALQSMRHNYKYELYKRVKPEIVIIGSSRALQYQKKSFEKTFLSLGGMASGPVEVQVSLKKLLKIHSPEIIVVSIDFWWMNNDRKEPYAISSNHHQLTKLVPSVSFTLEPYYWLLTGKIQLQQFFNRIFSSTESENTGVAGIVWKDGDDASGTHYYTARSLGQKGYLNNRFAESFAQLEKGKKYFAPAQHINSSRKNEFLEMFEFLENLESSGIEIILLSPPIAPLVFTAMEESKSLSYLTEIDELFKETEIEFYNLLDPSIVGTSDCEFFDAIHGGAITFRRVLLTVAEQTSTSFPEYLRLEEIKNTIQHNKNYASHPHKGEIDFLNLGCIK